MKTRDQEQTACHNNLFHPFDFYLHSGGQLANDNHDSASCHLPAVKGSLVIAAKDLVSQMKRPCLHLPISLLTIESPPYFLPLDVDETYHKLICTLSFSSVCVRLRGESL